MKYDIIIPTYLRSKWLYQRTLECFQSIIDNTDNYRIIWIDNGSKDKYRKQIINEIAPLQDGNKLQLIVKKDPIGFVKATNLGIKEALAEYIVFLNNDTIVTPNWLEYLTKHDCDITGPWPSKTDFDMKKWTYKNDRKSLNEYAKVCSAMDRLMPVEFIPFYCAVFKREVIDELGRLSEDYGSGLFDDDDYLWRAREKGYSIGIASAAYVLHFEKQTFLSIGEDKYRDQFQENWDIFKSKYPKWNEMERYLNVEKMLNKWKQKS